MGSGACFAAVGDVHGEHARMVDLLTAWERTSGRQLSFVLQVGDFEANRHENDRLGRSPDAHLGDFPAFLAGARSFPWPVFVMGGNHEPYAWLDGLEPGAELAPNCFWLGWRGSRKLGGLRIGWLGGIHSPKAFAGTRPLAGQGAAWKLSTYFTSEDVAAVAAAAPLDVLMLHDWPAGLVARGTADPFAGTAIKPWFVGNQPARTLVDTLQPRLVLCGHMHVAHRALIGDSVVRCLASVGQGPGACAFFAIEGTQPGGTAVSELGEIR